MANSKPHGHNWKGEEAGYAAKHIWLDRNYGKPQSCEKCNTTSSKKFHWANLSGLYKRERSDYMRLCVRCHLKMDDIGKNLGTGMLGKKQTPAWIEKRIKKGLVTRKVTKGY